MSTDRREDSLYKHKYRELLKAIEDIKAETQALDDGVVSYNNRPLVYKYKVLKIIDKHLGKESE